MLYKQELKILYVDDEEGNLRTFRLTFNREFTVFTCLSAQAAFEILEQQGEIPVIITDQRMPGMTGVEFLKRIIEEYPDSTRIILTAYTDSEALIEAINAGKAYRFIVKPWDVDELRQTLKGAFDHYFLSKENKRLLMELRSNNEELDSKNEALRNAMDGLKKVQAKLIQQEKKSVVGSLTTGLAHEIKNQLNAIGFLKSIEKDLTDEKREYLQYIYDGRDRIVNLINEVRGLVRDEEVQYSLSPQNLTPVIEESIFLAKMDPQTKGIDINSDTTFSGAVSINKNKIIQVLLNLIGNAVQAIGGQKEGRVTIKTELDNSTLQLHKLNTLIKG